MNLFNINWAVRLKNKTFWVTIIPLAFLLVSQILAIFGVVFDFEGIVNQLVNIVETVFLILGVLGVVVDHTTKGIGDSKQALTYDKPKEE